MIGQPLAELIEAERVTCAAGVPTIWTLLYQHLKEKTIRPLEPEHGPGRRIGRASRTMIENFERDFGIRILHAWGMTETSPLGTVSRLKGGDASTGPRSGSSTSGSSRESPCSGSSSRILGDHGEDLPWDGEHVGELARARARGSRQSYYNNPERERRVHRRRLVPHRRHGERSTATATSSSPTARRT